jgi:hypothetical protein
MQVTIGIASNGLWKDVMGVSLIQSLCVFPYDLTIASQSGPHIDENREVIVQQALEMKSDVLVFLDTDMVWPKEALNKLIEGVTPGETPRPDILGVPYNEKRLPPVSTTKMLGPDGEILVGVHAVPRQPFKCAAVGAGFMAINLHRLTECWPQGPYFEFGPTDGLARVGEDIEFCLRSGERNLSVWCDPRIIVRHCGDYLF